MTLHLGNIPASSTIYIPFHTFNSSGGSVTITGLAVGDILIYKNGGTTERSSTAGFTLLDTDGIDFAGKTGLHGLKIDLSDNTDAGFYAAGNHYMVAVSTITADGQTVSFWAATFYIGPAEVNAIQLSSAALTSINGEVVDALNVDTYAELSSVPAATSTLRQQISWLFMQARNKITQTNTTKTIRNDADSADVATATVSDDGTTTTRGEFV